MPAGAAEDVRARSRMGSALLAVRRLPKPRSSWREPHPARRELESTCHVAATLGNPIPPSAAVARSLYAAPIAVVPSTRRATGPHPLEEAIEVGPPRLREQVQTLLTRGRGSISRNRPAEDGYSALPAADGLRVLLVDDTFAGGAHLQSAAAALVAGGADVIAAVVLGRVVDTSDENDPEKRELWDRQRRTAFDFARCCLED